MPKIFYAISVFAFVLISCKSSENISKKQLGLNLQQLYKVWDVDSMYVSGKVLSGAEMGDPQYEFTKDGQRIKSYVTPPHKESVSYFIRNDSIHYKSEKALPSSAIAELTDSTLVLKNEKTTWKLYIKK
jgi:hypothetical protein